MQKRPSKKYLRFAITIYELIFSMARRGGKTSAIKGEDYTFFDLDSDALCRPSDLLIGGNVGHNFKHIETDFTPLQVPRSLITRTF